MNTYHLFIHKSMYGDIVEKDVKAANLDNLRKNLIKKYSGSGKHISICVGPSTDRIGWLTLNTIDVNGRTFHQWTVGKSSNNYEVDPKTGKTGNKVR